MSGDSISQTFTFEGPRGVLKLILLAVLFFGGILATWIAVIVIQLFVMTPHDRARISNLGEKQQYRSADLSLKPDPDRVVFLGDSITYLWNIPGDFGNTHYIDRGINAQTSADMLVRFRQDVINLEPKSVVILAGVNDMFEGSRRQIPEDVVLQSLEENDQTMAELAELHHIRPIFISILPLHSYSAAGRKAFKQVSPDMILTVNRWLRTYCAEHQLLYIDGYSALVDERGMLRANFSEDGVHPNSAGYQALTLAVKSAYRENSPIAP